jgi:cytochrome c
MNPARSPWSLSREARRDTGALPPRERETHSRSSASARVDGFDAAFPRGREKYVAAIALAAAIWALHGDAWAGALSGDANRGEIVYQTCEDCHSLDKNDVGPRHRGVYGRKAGSLPDYDYSDALKSANIVWDEETLDKWLTNPQAVAPGAKMVFHLESAQDRADVIAYLRERAK